MQLQQHKQEFDALGVNVVVVTFESEPVARRYAEETELPWPILLDPDRKLYAAYGMSRGSASQVMGPGSWWDYLKILSRGRKLHRPTGDVYQLGGDVLIDPQGTVRMHHVSNTSVDRPEISTILETVRR